MPLKFLYNCSKVRDCFLSVITAILVVALWEGYPECFFITTYMKTPISYYGGKQMLIKHISPLIPAHKIYTESFCGGATVLFSKAPVNCEIINDINADLINFYRIAKSNYADLKQEIDKSLHSGDIHIHSFLILTSNIKLAIDEIMNTFSIITVPASLMMKEVYNSGQNKHTMPLILSENDIQQ